MRIYLESLGCRLNYAEMAALSRQLVSSGHDLAAAPDDADICILNSCAVTGEAARKSRQLARQMARANPRARVVITGCHATLEGESLRALPNVALVVGNAHKDDLPTLIQDLGGSLQSPNLPLSGRDSQSALRGRTRGFVKVQDGCRNRCTFCIVAVARGAERSRPIAEVVTEINALHRDGCQEVVLTGVHLGAYGRDQAADLSSLICALLNDTAIPRLRLSSLEPFDLTPGFFELWSWSGNRLMPHLHLPAQSGSDRVLRRMARRNSVAHFESLVEGARMRIPGLTITTDLIVGFPGEDEVDFEETVTFARRIGFAHMHVFAYSARAGTAAARFKEQVPATERRHRARVLNELDEELSAVVRSSFVGETRRVLWESQVPWPVWHGQDGRVSEDAPRSRDIERLAPGSGGVETSAVARGLGTVARDQGMALWSGLTDNYLRVQTEVPVGVNLHNCITATRLTREDADGLSGEIVSRRFADDTGGTPKRGFKGSYAERG